jgi:hypothetical protein
VSTGHLERLNLSIQIQMRRFTRLTNGFSKEVENHKAALDKSLRVTPAMEAGVADHVWSLEEIAALAD